VRPPKLHRNSVSYKDMAKGAGRRSFCVRRLSDNARPGLGCWGRTRIFYAMVHTRFELFARLGVLFAGRDPSDRGHYRSQRSRGRTYLPIAAALALENSQLCLCKKTLSFRIPTSPIAKDQTWRDSTELVEEVEPHAGSRACALCLKYCGVTLVRC
jgi:hypothetical protein